MKNCYLLIFLLCVLHPALNAQMITGGAILVQQVPAAPNNEIAFSNQNGLLSLLNFSSEIIVGVADMNGDKLDDIIRLENARYLTIEYQSVGEPYSHYVFGDISDQAQWSLAIADVDANGYNDILLAGDSDGVKLLQANASGTEYSTTMLPGPYFFAQGSNFSDINNDGYTDIFVCNDLGDNHIWENDGLGNFSIADNWIDMSTIPASDNSGNYASIWTDFDNDGDLDLYISKCKAGVTNPTDPRRVNQLFVNEDDTFSEQAEIYGLKSGAQSWTSDFQDIDNDGDLDCLLINHLEASQLFENDGNGFFTDITDQSGLQITLNHLQGQMRDFDNDGFVDILVAGNEGYEYYENNGDQTFTKIPDVFGSYPMGTFAIGDLNHDGFQDLYSGSASSNDVLWMNSRNENHFFSVNLTGTESNINALGSRLMLYGPWGVQIREVRAGESYGINNSFTQHFGLGASTQIDSLVIQWPSGLREVFVAPQIDQFLCIVEAECAYPDRYISFHGALEFCTGDSLLLRAPAGNQFLWSNGAQSQSVQITEGGTYQVTVTNAYGCSSVSYPLTLVQDPDETPQIVVIGNTTFCEGESTTLFSTAADAYLWSTNATSQTITVNESGSYFVTTEGLCGNYQSDPVNIQVVPLPDAPAGQNDTITETPASAVLSATGDNLYWFNSPAGGDTLGTGNVFITPEISETTAFYVEEVIEQNNISCQSNRTEVLAVVDIENSLISLDADGSILVFPNPTEDHLMLQNKSVSDGDWQISLYSLAGEIVISWQLSGLAIDERQQLINLKDVASGMYLLSIKTEGHQFFKKVIIQK